MESNKTTLGNSHIKISELGIGTWAWGDKFIWGYRKSQHIDQDIRAAFDASIAAGINFFDTAEIYGSGRSEKLLGEFSRQVKEKFIIATKFFPFPWRLGEYNLHRALQKSLERLQKDQVDLYQIHMSTPPRTIETWVRAAGKEQIAGLSRHVGVSNYSVEQTKRSQTALAAMGIDLASNQVLYNLLNRKIENTGLLDLCLENNITVIAYSPLAMGMLTGKYSQNNPPPGVRGRRYTTTFLKKLSPLLSLMEEIGHGHGAKTPAQIALNWTICKGSVPIPGAKNARQAEENAGAMGWRLGPEEVRALDQASNKVLDKS